MKLFVLLSVLVVVVLAARPGRFDVHREGSPLVTPEMVAEINSKATTWRAGVNPRFVGASREQIKAMLGAKKGYKLPPKKHFRVSPDALPTQFDSRVQWPDCASIKAVRDQSACGSCYAFAAVEAMSDRICINYHKNVSLSSADAAFCCSECGGGCEGGWPSLVWQYYQRTGIVEEGCWPYPFASCDHHQNGSSNPCPSNEYPSPKCQAACNSKGWNGPSWDQDRHHASSVYNIDGGETAIMQEIYSHGPVETAFTVYEDFVSYRSGVYKHTWGQELGGHAVKIIGWGVDSAGTKFWTVANSWNVDFGEKGFFRIIRGINDCGFEDEVNGGIPKSFP